MMNLAMQLAGGAHMTPAAKFLTYVIFPALAASIPVAIVAIWRANRAATARATARAVADRDNAARLDTQDQALARILEIISPVGSPSLTVVLARIQADSAAQAQRLDDHIRAAAADKAAFEQRLERIGGGRV